MKDYQTKEYWDKRTLEGIKKNDYDNMIFEDRRLKDYRERVSWVLRSVKPEWKVLDVCCGFGYFAQFFKPEQYLGIDFSEEMIKLAREKNPGYKFQRADAKDFKGKFDVVFEVNSGRVLNDNDFNEIEKMLSRLSDKAIMILEADYMLIKYAPFI